MKLHQTLMGSVGPAPLSAAFLMLCALTGLLSARDAVRRTAYESTAAFRSALATIRLPIILYFVFAIPSALCLAFCDAYFHIWPSSDRYVAALLLVGLWFGLVIPVLVIAGVALWISVFAARRPVLVCIAWCAAIAVLFYVVVLNQYDSGDAFLPTNNRPLGDTAWIGLLILAAWAVFWSFPANAQKLHEQAMDRRARVAGA